MNMKDRVLSDYKLTKPLGAGAMGTVYEGINLQTGQKAAVKLISSGNFSTKEYNLLKKRLNDEATSVRKLDSPWIVKVLNIGEDKDLGLHLILELMEGTSLEDELSTPRKWTGTEFIKKVARPLLMGLANLHEYGVLHRDIKPANLLKSLDGSYKISDFGLALFEGRQAKTQTGIIIGTPGYMAPECINEGANGTTELSDIYSAGATLYYAITGKQAFAGRSIIETVSSQLNPVINTNGLLNNKQNFLQVTPAAANLIMSTLYVDPQMRPQSASDFFNKLSMEIKNKTDQVKNTRNRKSSSHENLRSENITISGDLNKRPDRKNKAVHDNQKKQSPNQKLPAQNPGFFEGKGKILSFLLCTVLLLSLVFFYSKKTHFSQHFSTGGGTTLKIEFMDAITEINSLKTPLSVKVLKKTIDSGTQWLNSLGKGSSLSPGERLKLVNKIASALEEGPFPSLGAFIVARTRNEASELTIENLQYLIQEMRQYNLSYSSQMTAKELPAIIELEKHILETQLKSISWINELTQFSRDFDLVLRDSENNLEEIVTAIISAQQEKTKTFGKDIELAAAPFRLDLNLLQSACFADPSGGLAMKLQGESTDAVQELRLDAESSANRYKTNEVALDKKAVNLDIANAIVLGVREVLVNITLPETIKNDLGSKISIIRDYIEETEQKIVKAAEVFKNNAPETQNRNSAGKTKFYLQLDPPIYKETSFTKNSYSGTISLHTGLVEYAVREYGVTAPLKSLSKNQISPNLIYDVTRLTQIRKLCVLMRRMYWYLYPAILNLNCITSNLKKVEIYNGYYTLEKSHGHLMEGPYTLELFRRIHWLGPDLNQKTLADRTANCLQSYLRHSKTRNLMTVAKNPELENEMANQVDCLRFFAAIKKLIITLNRQADTSTRGELDGYRDVANTFYNHLSKRVSPYVKKDTILWWMYTNKALYIPGAGNLSDEETKESIKKGSQILETLSAIDNFYKSINKRTKKSIREGNKFDVLYAEYLEIFLGKHWQLLRRTGNLTQLRKESKIIFHKFLPFAHYFSSPKRTRKIPIYSVNGYVVETRLIAFNLAVVHLGHIAIVEKDEELKKIIFPLLPMVKVTACKKLRRDGIVQGLQGGKPIPVECY